MNNKNTLHVVIAVSVVVLALIFIGLSGGLMTMVANKLPVAEKAVKAPVASAKIDTPARQIGKSSVKNPAYNPDTTLAESWVLNKGPEGPEAVQLKFSVEEAAAGRFYAWPMYAAGEAEDITSFGGMLNFKYHAGRPYQTLREALPGKTIFVDVVVPSRYVSANRSKPNGLRVGIKAVRDKVWTDYYGDYSWVNVNHDGVHHFELKIPDNPVTLAGGKVFDPNDIIVFFVEFHSSEAAVPRIFPPFYITNFRIEGIGLDASETMWQYIKNGNAENEVFLPMVAEGGTVVTSLGHTAEFIIPSVTETVASSAEMQAGYDKFFLMVPVKLPPELRGSKGAVTVTVSDAKNKAVRSRLLTDSDRQGDLSVAVPVDDFLVKKDGKISVGDAAVTVDVTSRRPHTLRMQPILIAPAQITNGRYIYFDEQWQVRTPDEDKTVQVKELGPELAQLELRIQMAGGIDWGSPFYKAELTKPLGDKPVDCDNMRIEVLVSPRTDTAKLWQKPYRARIGLVDENGKVMLGPNVSISEGLSSLAYLDVTTACPTPKGLVMPGFDPKKVKSIMLNVEASNERGGTGTVDVTFLNMRMRPIEFLPGTDVRSFDYSRFAFKPDSWQISRLIKEKGFFVGMNYPFPALPMIEFIMAVPQIYPCVGMKPTDPEHLGLGSSITKPSVISDFKDMVGSGILLTRIMTLGHLEGVFNWDPTGRDIRGFSEGFLQKIDTYAAMDIASFTEYLNRHGDEVFLMNGNNPQGFEEHVVGDFLALLDILEEVESQTGTRLMAILSLYDFLLGDGISREGPYRIYLVGEHPEVVTDPAVKVKAHALIWKLMKILKADPRFEKYIAIVEIMNEPDNATSLATPQHFPELVNFIGEGLYLLKDALGPTVPVSVGFRSWAEDLRYWQPIAGGIDILTPHYWESLESYNIDSPGMWPLDTPVEKLWEYLGTDPKGRIAAMGEISPAGNVTENFDRLKKAGYAFALIWSYSGHDGHYGKKVLGQIADYQKKALGQEAK